MKKEFFKLLKPDMVVTSIRIDSSKLERIDKAAYVAGISRNETIIQCIDYAINNLPAESR